MKDMMEVKIDDWSCSHGSSGFYVEMAVLPRMGEGIRIHRDVCGGDFRESHQEAFEHAIDGFAYFVVTEVEHSYSLAGSVVEIGVTERGDY